MAEAFPSHWLLYVSFQCSPPRSIPLDIDVMVVMEDRVLLLELKDLNGELKANGDQWQLGQSRTFRSPVDDINLKAKKVATLLAQSITGWNTTYTVDARVLLSGTANRSNLQPQEKPFVLTVAEVCTLPDAAARKRLLARATLPAKRPWQFQTEFDRVTRNPKLFRPRERSWGGYRTTDEDVAVHPRDLWREHQGELMRDPRQKALIRVWAFDRLGAKLNSPDQRRFVAERELRAIGRLEALNSRLLQGGVLMPLSANLDEVLTQHFDLRRLPVGWVTLDRFLEREAQILGPEDRKVIAATLINAVAELHAQGIAHRDLGPRCIWVGDETQQALTSFIACQMPEETSLGDWLPVLQSHGVPGDAAVPGKVLDVRALGRLALQIFGQDPALDPAIALGALDPAFDGLRPWLQRVLTVTDGASYQDAVEASADFGVALDQEARPQVDQVLLDRRQTNILPYTQWRLHDTLQQTSEKHVYRSAADVEGEPDVIVKLWFDWKRGALAAEVGLMRLFRGVARIQEAHRSDLPRFLDCGLSSVGAFITYSAVDGEPWSTTCETPLSALRRGVALLRALEALHGMDLDHGDLSARNVLVREGDEVVLVDLFDYADVGDGRVVAGENRPDNAELLSPREVDRYAALTLIETCLAPWRDGEAAGIVALLVAERARDRIETLEPVLTALEAAIAGFIAPPKSSVRLYVPGVAAGPLEPDGVPIYARAFERGNAVEYVVSGPARELVIVAPSAGPARARVRPTTFNSLGHASIHGAPLELTVILDSDPSAFAERLVEALSGQVTIVRDTPRVRARRSEGSNLDVPAYWRRLLALEEEHQPSVLVTAELTGSDELGAYAYERLGADFDFDPEDQVEVRLPSGGKVGELDLGQTDGRVMTIRLAAHRTLRAGDRVFLVERRTRTSFDRRQKAVDRVLKREAAVPDVIDYFASGAQLAATDYGVTVADEDLQPYGLNVGQREAFHHVARYGPVALQQGPPGTGKTRFIAAFVHWLVTKQGAGRILIASQSHEAVNNAIEALVDLFKALGGERPSLLRIGSKGITEKIRPFHTRALRERYQVRFDAAFRHRVANIASAMGLRRAFAQDAADLDRSVGEPARRVMALDLAGDLERGRISANERRQNERSLEVARTALCDAAAAALGETCPDIDPDLLLDLVFDDLRRKHPGVSEGDTRKVRQVLELAREWSASLASSDRNFEEFLAKTRTVVTATCVGVGQTKIRVDTRNYDWVIIDEAARCTASELAVPIQVGQRILLVGDHLQLKPMIDEEVLRDLRAEMPGIPASDLARSDFERAFTSAYGRANGKTFDEQYRMAPAICSLVSAIFYQPHDVQLTTSPDREPNLAFDGLSGPLDQPVVWVDTSNSPDRGEKASEWNRHTFWNPAEVNAALSVLERLAREDGLVASLAASLEETPIGVICMYAGQKAALDQAFSERSWDAKFRRLVRIDTVDSYQGKENSIVILSLVRSNADDVRGHVSSFNRCNVALSRAKERLFVLGDRTMWAKSPADEPMHQVLRYMEGGPEGVAVLEPADFQ